MHDILFQYDMTPTTWVYLSSLMIIGIYFRFHRFWSVRNLDLLGLITFAPGLLMVGFGLRGQGPAMVQWGYTWLMAVSALFLLRLLVDPLMVRRPLLEPNLSAGGLSFATVALMAFLVGNVLAKPLTEVRTSGPLQLDDLFNRQAADNPRTDLVHNGPGFPPLYALADAPARAIAAAKANRPEHAREVLVQQVTARTVAVLGHLAVLLGIVLIGYRHFDNAKTGMAAAAMYLLLPYTAQMTGRLDHVVPAALLVWAIEEYRRPLISGLLAGAASGMVFFPLFLLPLWCSFYWRRGLLRFLAGTAAAILILVGILAFTAPDMAALGAALKQMFGWTAILPAQPEGLWQYYEGAYRIPVMAIFLALSLSMALWPAQKNLGTLVSCSAAVMLATQFWHPYQGGLYLDWYLPPLILTVLRPNLEDRMALTTVRELRLSLRFHGWLGRVAGRKTAGAAGVGSCD